MTPDSAIAVVISAEDYVKLAGERDFKAFLLSAPDMEHVEIVRLEDLRNAKYH